MSEVHAISLGAGVQSSTMALMAAVGELTPMPDFAVFADTHDEPPHVYEWLSWLEKQLPFPVHRVSAGNLMQEALRMRTSRRSGNSYLAIGLPVYTVDADGSKGIGMRQCTRTFKIDPIRRKLRELRVGAPVIQWIGISSDEWIRMKPSRDKWCTNRWPLIEKGMSRMDCFAWMERRGFPRPPRSACKKCPFRSEEEWLSMKTDRPDQFAEVVAFERQLQAGYSEATALRSTPFLHASRVPLDQVQFRPDLQMSLLDAFGNECEGMCGV